MGEIPIKAREVEALIIGGGPAGLMAAEVLGRAGLGVLVAESKPSVGRKFLMAGKSGLNLTFDTDADELIAAFGPAAPRFDPMVREFDSSAIRAWAASLGQETFVGSTGRVFPVAMKASPLLRSWLGRLSDCGVEVQTRWRWTGWEDDAHVFRTPDGRVTVSAKATLLALGGASWSRLGSDGAWATMLAAKGVGIAPFRPANAGLHVAWSDYMRPNFGTPVKGTELRAGDARSRSEYVVSARGLEGGGVYSVFGAVREGCDLVLDLLPDLSLEDVAKRLGSANRKDSRSNRLRKALRMDRVRIALFNEFATEVSDAGIPKALKALPVRHRGPRPMDEAISTAGGVRWDCVDEDLTLTALPGIHVAGEMLDWEAPTGDTS